MVPLIRLPGMTSVKSGIPNDTLDHLIRRHFAQVARDSHLVGPLGETVGGLAKGDLTRSQRREILIEAGYLYDLAYRKAELDLLLSFAGSALATKSFDDEHQVAFELLKSIFEVEEG